MPVLVLKIFAFLKAYWYVPIAIIVSIILIFVFRKKNIDVWDILENATSSHEKELNAISKIEDDKQKKTEQLHKDYQIQIANIESQFIKEKQELDSQKKEDIANMVVKYRKNPDLMAKKLADKYGFTIIPPEK